jgi:hypothetical protein
LLCAAHDMGKYLDSGPVFNGYVIPQNHLYLDRTMSTDTPVRLFRKAAPIQFYGCIHEQPQMGDCNGDVTPCLQVADVQIAHTGYLHENIRREKALTRNLPLLVRDQEVFPDRELGKLLVLRDYANLAMWSREAAGGAMTPEVQKYYGLVVGLFEERFMDPEHRFYGIARPFYEQALTHVAGAIQVELGLAGAKAPNGLNGNHAQAERVWVRTPDHLRTLLHQRIEVMLKPLEHTPTMDVTPWPLPEPALTDISESFNQAVSA